MLHFNLERAHHKIVTEIHKEKNVSAKYLGIKTFPLNEVTNEITQKIIMKIEVTASFKNIIRNRLAIKKNEVE